MKKLLFLLPVFGILAGCAKKYTCSYDIIYARPCFVAFSGFSNQDIETIVVARYKADSDELLQVDTVHITNVIATGDTLYAYSDTGKTKDFLRLDPKVDYKINMLEAQREFKLTGISTGPSSYTWQQSTNCSSGAGQARISTLSNIHINGVKVDAFDPPATNYSYYVYLQH